jgi:hypothetical protein
MAMTHRWSLLPGSGSAGRFEIQAITLRIHLAGKELREPGLVWLIITWIKGFVDYFQITHNIT